MKKVIGKASYNYVVSYLRGIISSMRKNIWACPIDTYMLSVVKV